LEAISLKKILRAKDFRTSALTNSIILPQKTLTKTVSNAVNVNDDFSARSYFATGGNKTCIIL